VNLDVRLRNTGLEIKCGEIRRLCSCGIDLGKFLRCSAAVFRASNPNIVGELNASVEEVVPSVNTKDCAETILEIVASRRLEVNTVNLAVVYQSAYQDSSCGDTHNQVRQKTREIHMQ
jgi:hypothetical protein